ncbi:MAG: YkgJ family cysteine cluster protein [Crenarchaeota archaeon]|nr:YkgJ family cysteine cluster protein [Thermoproteota archaeon]
MVETFYVHLKFFDKTKENYWSINLPFLCSKCGVCCSLENFLTAGKIEDLKNTRPDVAARFRTLADELGKLWEQDEAKYDHYIINTLCPFLKDNVCTIYEIRPKGCRLYPNTKFGIESTDCESLNRFKKQKIALTKNKNHKEIYSHITIEGSKFSKPFKRAQFNEGQFQACVDALKRVGVTESELALFELINRTK